MASLSRIAATPDLTEQVYQRLLYAICDGGLAPGARLTQEDLAATLGVSRQPVLQALRLLKKEGFVSDAGRRGLRVAPLETPAITQVYEVRAVLDGLAARRAAQAHAQLDPTVLLEGRRAVLSQSSIFGQNPKIWCQEFNDLQTPKCSKKQLCDRTSCGAFSNRCFRLILHEVWAR